jgi:glucosamine--fructose-6-phosphate aminotransferase (isomerizing)
MLSILIGRQKNISRTEAKVYIDNIRKLPDLIREALSLSKKISGLSKKYGMKDAIDFLGRQYMYPIALESSLKLKELAYLNSNAYPSGEIKHGPLAVIGKGRACLYFATQSSLVEKDISTMREIKSREGKLILIKTKSQKIPKDCYDDVLSIPDLEEYLAPIVSVVVSQIFCMDFARKRNKDIDKPRHLAKSVTVE